MTNQNVGTIVTVIGAVLDIKFHPDHLPNLLNAIEIDNNGHKLVVEVAQHIGDDIVRCIAMGSTDGLVRGMEAVDTGASIKVPVGKETLGRIFNLLGEAVDNKPQPRPRKSGRSTVPLRNSRSRRLPTRFLRLVSRSLTLSRRTSRAVR